MIQVKLVYDSATNPVVSASHAAKMCYQAEPPAIGERMDVESNLFKTGHHTTLQHYHATFLVDGIAVGDITFGFHLASPFYNSDQRSGRFCAKMFISPDFPAIEDYIRNFWPAVTNGDVEHVIAYVKNGIRIYQEHIERTARAARWTIIKERPFANEKYIEQNAPKIAQEQLRVFIPIIFPTGFVFTVNASALIALYESAWTPAMKYATSQMAIALFKKYPQEPFNFLFREDRRESREWAPPIKPSGDSIIRKEPGFQFLSVDRVLQPTVPITNVLHPVDKLHFMPEYMDNAVNDVKCKVAISAATMGQDQRHRTIRRSAPEFTGEFYLPPIVDICGLEEEAKTQMQRWLDLSQQLPPTLAAVIAPYGAVVSYVKSGSLNAIIHEQAKRLCWCAQEEIYHVARELRRSMRDSEYGDLAEIFEPYCLRTGVCAEGKRYCGRDIKDRNDYFPRRMA